MFLFPRFCLTLCFPIIYNTYMCIIIYNIWWFWPISIRIACDKQRKHGPFFLSLTHAIPIESVQSHIILYRVSQDPGTPPFFSLFLKIHFGNFSHPLYLANVIFWHINIFLFAFGFTGSDANFWFLIRTPCIFLKKIYTQVS